MKTIMTADAITAHDTVIRSIEPTLTKVPQQTATIPKINPSEALSQAQQQEVEIIFAEEIRSHSPVTTDTI